MEIRFSDEALAFEQEVKAFLEREWGPERRRRSLMRQEAYDDEQALRTKLAAKGWLTLAWPEEYGGQARSFEQQYLFYEALNAVGAPFANIAVQQVGPTIMRFGSEDQKREILPRIARGEIECALGYTEPDAGTDLASLQLRAVRNGDEFTLNGVKRFTSRAHRAEYVWLAARTDPEAPKHRGISMFLADLAAPGITVRPLWTMAGYRTNEVYYDDVRVPVTALVGEENRGWYYATHALDRERLSIFTVSSVRAVFEALLDWARARTPDGRRPADEPWIRCSLANFKVELEVLQMLSYRNLALLARGDVPNYEASMGKIFSTELMQRLQNAGTKMLGLHGQLTPEEQRAPLEGRIEYGYLAAVMPTFGAGANEVQRNIIAQRGFGLPRA